MINFCNTLLGIDKEQPNAAVMGRIIKPKPVIDNITDVAVESRITTASTDSNIEVSVLIFS